MKNIKEIIALICCCNLVFPVPMAIAAPQGGKVVGGSAHIHQSGATTTINQSSNRAVINWNSFDIGKNETVRHNMPSANSAGLHRVVGGGGASQIMGQLQSNGNVYLVNPAGVVIHKGARIDANSFTATSRDISNDNFMKGTMVFDKPGRPDAEVINQGTISVKENGLAALVAPTVRNDGVIAGKLAKVALASGDSTWKLDMHGDDLITFTVDEKDVGTLHAVDGTPLAGVENSGSIKAEGGVVVLTAAQLDGIVGSVVNSGEVSAASAELKGGKIVFKGAGSGVDIVNTGTVDASSAVADGGSVRMDTDGKVRSSGLIAATGGQKGGKVVVTGKDVALTGKAKIDVSGNKGGGTALVGGNALGKGPERNAQTTKVEKDATIVADARTKGDGGQVVVWSDEKTNFDGTITARGGSNGGNGGKVETSGKSLKVGDTAQVDTRASKGIHGQWLLDPMDFVIAASGGDISGSILAKNLENQNVVINSTDGQGGNSGNIDIKDSIAWFSNFNLTLNASNAVNVHDDITLHGDYSSLYIITSPGGTIYADTGKYNLHTGKITFLGKNNKYFINNNEYKLIHSIDELQHLDSNYKFYAIANDIDASSTKVWNNGSGFIPLEDITGVLNGGNHTINELYINFPEKSSVGLIGWTRLFSVNNLGLLNVDITGHSDVGGLIGTAFGADVRIKAIGITGKVAGIENVGGVLGSYNTTSGDISESYSYASVEGDSNVGGFAGYLNRGVWGSYSSGNVYGKNNVGGFVGYARGGSYSFSYSRGDILGSPSIAGGFVGYAENSSFRECYSTGSLVLHGNNWKHGFIGNCKNVIAYNCYVDINSSNSTDDPLNGHGVFGVSTAYMKSGSVFSGYPWIEDGINYPELEIYTFALNGDDNNPSTDPIPTPDPGTNPTPTPDPDPTPTPDPDPTPTPDPDPTPTPDPDTGLNPGPDDDESAEGKYPGGGMVLYDELLGKHYLFKDNTKYYIITDEPTRVGGMSVINRTEMKEYESKINSEIQNINEYYDELMKDATWDLGLTAIRIELSTILSALNPFDLMKGGVGVVGSLVIDAIKADEKVAYSNSYRLQCGYYLLLEQYLVNSNYYLQEAKYIYDNAVLNDRGLSAYEKRQISDLLKNSEKCLENTENIRNNKKEIESWLTTYAIGETSNDLFSLGLSSTLDAIPVKTSSDAEEILTNVVKEGSVNTVEESLDLGSINANDVFNLCTTNIPWNSEVGKVKKNFENSFNRTLNI